MAREAGSSDAALLLDMLTAARDARDFVAGMEEQDFRDSRLHQNAVIRAVEVIGEAAGKVSAEFQAAHPELPWREVTGMRHRLIHGYAQVRLDIVWAVVRGRIPLLIAALEPLVPED